MGGGPSNERQTLCRAKQIMYFRMWAKQANGIRHEQSTNGAGVRHPGGPNIEQTSVGDAVVASTN
jgi:hypothetical protein